MNDSGTTRLYLVLLALAAIMVLALMPPFWLEERLPVAGQSVFDLLHFPAAIITAVLIYQLTRSPAVAVVLTLLLALGLELVQPWFGRNDSIRDLHNGLLGVLFAAFILGSWRQGMKSLSLFFVGMAVALMVVSLQPLLQAYHQQQRLRAGFPMLGDFENSDYSALWKPMSRERIALVPRGNGGWALLLNGEGIAWPGVVYLPVEHDWRHMGHLCFEARATRPDTTLVVRLGDTPPSTTRPPSSKTVFHLNDRWHRYCMRIEGLQTTGGRWLAKEHIHRLMFVMEQRESTDRLLLDNVRLIPE